MSGIFFCVNSKQSKSLTLTISYCIIGALTGGENFYASKGHDQNGNVRRAVLCDGAYCVPAAIHARLCNSVDIRAKFNGVSFNSASNVHDNFSLYFNGSGRLASFREWRGLKSLTWSSRRILFCVARRISAVEFFQGRDAKFKTVHLDEYFNRSADNLPWRINLNDFAFGRGNLASVDNGGVPIYFRRRVKSDGGGIFGR